MGAPPPPLPMVCSLLPWAAVPQPLGAGLSQAPLAGPKPPALAAPYEWPAVFHEPLNRAQPRLSGPT